jgi:antitoxin Phd
MRAAARRACQSAAIDAALADRYLLSSYLARKAPMDGSQWSLQDAKNSFSAVVEAALEGTPQHVTKRGKPAVVVLSETDYERLSGKTEKLSFVEHLLSAPRGSLRLGRTKIKMRDIKF